MLRHHLALISTVTWYDFACEILKDIDVDVKSVTSSKLPQKAYRPRHSIMSLDKAKGTGFVIPSWQDALTAFLESIRYIGLLTVCVWNIWRLIGMIQLWLIDHDDDIYHYEFQIDEDQKGNVLFSKSRKAIKFTDDEINNSPEPFRGSLAHMLFDMYQDNDFKEYFIRGFY